MDPKAGFPQRETRRKEELGLVVHQKNLPGRFQVPHPFTGYDRKKNIRSRHHYTQEGCQLFQNKVFY
jgi:hypothetical protein